MSARVIDYKEAVDHLPEGTAFVVRDVPWEEYDQLLQEFSDRPRLRVTYDQGKLEIMSPLSEHEEYKRFIEKLVDALGDHLDTNVEPRGSATWRKQKSGRGTEPDTCYYIANADRIVGKRAIDLNVDPPPDLVVEIDSTNESLAKFPIYSNLEVPEIWRYDVKNKRIHMYELRGDAYVEVPASRSFPVLSGEVLAEFVEQSKALGQKAAMAAFREWLMK